MSRRRPTVADVRLARQSARLQRPKDHRGRLLIEAVAAARPWVADFAFGYRVDRVVEAALISAEQGRWV
jgi:hypothetical protein